MATLIRYVGLVCLFGLIVRVDAEASLSREKASDFAQFIRSETPFSKGLCSMIGADDAELVTALALETDFFIHAQCADRDQVKSICAGADRERLCGKRIVAEYVPTNRLLYAKNTVDLVIVFLPSDRDQWIDQAEIYRVLRPRGIAAIGFTGAGERADVEQWLSTDGWTGGTWKSGELGEWVFVQKKPIPGADEWSHWEHSPDNNPVSIDTIVKAPYMTQFMGLPYYIAMPAVTTASAGRIFLAMGHIAHHEREEPWLNTLMARNGYNGAELWTRKLPDGYLVHRSAFVATETAFFMIDTDGDGCLLLDPESGYEIDRIEPSRLRGDWKWIAKQDGILYALIGKEKDPSETTIVRSEYSHWSWGELSKGYYQKRVPWGFGSTIAAIGIKDKKVLWTLEEENPVDSRAMVMGGGKLFIYGPDSHIRCVNAETGEVVWTNDSKETRDLIEQPGQGLTSTPGFKTSCFSIYTPEVIVYQAQTNQNVVAVSTEDGRLLWHRPKTTSNPNMLYVDGRLLVGIGPDGSTLALNPLTGETIEDLGFKKRSCARLTATSDSFFCRGWPEGITRYDRINDVVQFNGAMRPSCNDGVIAANGLLYVGPWLCDCNLSLMGSAGLCSAGEFQFGINDDGVERLETGNLTQKITAENSTEKDWPTYRGGNDRSAFSPVSLADSGVHLWTYEPPVSYSPTAPVAANGRIFVGGDDGAIRALNASTGLLDWVYTTAGPINHAPTYWKGRLYAGSADGYVYALHAATGELIWRFRAAPVERRIMLYGSLCSTWPVNTGIIVENGVAYAAAGTIDYDGTYVYALDAETGKMLWVNDSSGHLDTDLRKGVSVQGTMTVAAGRLWMPGGNVISPAVYRLNDGAYVGEGPFDGSPRSNRGEEISALGGRTILLGGRLRYSATENVVDPGTFQAFTISDQSNQGAEVQICMGKIAPAWSDSRMVVVNGRRTIPVCYSLNQVESYIQKGDPNTPPEPLWKATALEGKDTVSFVAAPNAFAAVCEGPGNRTLQTRWTVCALNAENGALLWEQTLSDPAVPGGILIDRDGRIVVVLQGGKVSAIGGGEALKNYVESLVAAAETQEQNRERAIALLRQALQSIGEDHSRKYLMKTLLRLGVDVCREARDAGYVTDWRILGPLEWSLRDVETDVNLLKTASEIQPSAIKQGDKTLGWRNYISDHPKGMVDLNSMLGPGEAIAAYAYADFELPESQPVQIKLGSNDGYVCWVNGTEVGRFDSGRGYVPDQDTLKAEGRTGRNRILVKITQLGNAWAYGVRVTDLQGNPVPLVPNE